MQGGDSEDIAKAQRLLEIDRRYVAAIQQVMPGSVTEPLVAELQAILDAYDRLYRSGPPSFPLFSTQDLQRKMADTVEFIARAHESLSRVDQAKRYYQQAAERFQAIGAHQEAGRCRAKAAQADFVLDADVDAEIRRLRAALDEATEPSLARAQVQVELGELLSKAGDDFEALRTLQEAERLLDRVVGPPEPDRLAAAFQASMAALRAGTARAGETELERLILARGLYLRTYLAQARAYRETDTGTAQAYEARARRLHAGEGQVDEIVAQLTRQLGPPAPWT